jgi:hypothetical protein
MPKTGKSNGNNKAESMEATLWQTADKMRKNMDAAEYKHIRILNIDKPECLLYDKNNIPTTPLPQGTRNMVGFFMGQINAGIY